MPELPEVETVLRGIRSRLRNRRIVKAKAFSPQLRIPIPRNFVSLLQGKRINAITRRAKFLRFHLDSGKVLLLHLGMTGNVRLSSCVEPYRRQKHDHALIEFEGNLRLVFNDPRRFGLITFANSENLESHPFFKKLGPEPLSKFFSGQSLHTIFLRRHIPVKLALCDQKIIAGVGNIYASEALFRARIHPRRLASSIKVNEAQALASAVKKVLKLAIASGGSSLRDYRRSNGRLGEFQNKFMVYGREGQSCLRQKCNGSIKRIVQGNRSTFLCPVCQHN